MELAQNNLAKETFETKGIEGREDRVKAIKSRAEDLFSEIEAIQSQTGSSEVNRLVALAKTQLEMAVMWAVKAVSRNQ